MQHFLKGENIGLVVSRQCVNDWRYVFLSKHIVEFNLTGTAGRLGSGYVFPLYLYHKVSLGPGGYPVSEGRIPNLNRTIVDEISKLIGLPFSDEKEEFGQRQDAVDTFSPIDILDYIYAVLHCHAYRERYKEFLKIDFPRIPYPDNAEKFWSLVKSDQKLRRLHLLEGVEPHSEIAAFPIAGSNEIVKPEYITGKVYINDTQFFDNVPDVAWNFQIGGYQPAQKWLKDRKGRILNFEDIRHYQRIILSLQSTSQIINEIELL